MVGLRGVPRQTYIRVGFCPGLEHVVWLLGGIDLLENRILITISDIIYSISKKCTQAVVIVLAWFPSAKERAPVANHPISPVSSFVLDAKKPQNTYQHGPNHGSTPPRMPIENIQRVHPNPKQRAPKLREAGTPPLATQKYRPSLQHPHKHHHQRAKKNAIRVISHRSRPALEAACCAHSTILSHDTCIGSHVGSDSPSELTPYAPPLAPSPTRPSIAWNKVVISS